MKYVLEPSDGGPLIECNSEPEAVFLGYVMAVFTATRGEEANAALAGLYNSFARLQRSRRESLEDL